MPKIKTEEGSENSGILKLWNAWLCNSFDNTICALLYMYYSANNVSMVSKIIFML